MAAWSRLFVMPEALLRWKDLGRRLQNSRIYVIAKMALEQVPKTTSPNLVAILGRSFDTMLRSSYRQALSVVRIFCGDHNLSLRVAAIRPSPDGGNMLSFDTVVMRKIFDDAVARAQQTDFWLTPRPETPPTPTDVLRPAAAP
jgi:hypothetical protein